MMKKIVKYTLIIGLMLLLNLSVDAHRQPKFGWFKGGDRGGGTAGAPLDGGILTILAAAGVTYFVARKKNKKKE